jgi:hypothetical protein
MIVVRNTYPLVPGVAHANKGDVCQWELLRGHYRLVRTTDQKSVYTSQPVGADGCLYSTKKSPCLVGVIAQIKNKGWILEIE